MIEDELAMFSNLRVQCFGEVMQWRKGLLSGWRFTSLWGSMVSALYCEMFREKVDSGSVYAVQGDDIFIMPTREVEKERCMQLADELGLQINTEKTSRTSIGEFLKYRYHREKVDGYPARTVRSIFYANPWLDKYAVVNPSQIAESWWMYLSRLTLCANCGLNSFSHFSTALAHDIASWWG